MKRIVLPLVLAFALSACQNKPTAQENPTAQKSTKESKAVPHPKELEQPTIYEVNIRQYTPEGTFNAFAKHLPRLEQMGVKILWFMPIQPIGEKNRKGGLGSYYSISDYTAVNAHYGTLDDFKAVVAEAHERGMLVILDWVANHTAYDHPWTEEHPDWYTRDEEGNIVSPVKDWSDVADLNYEKPALRKAMQEEMKYWINEAGIDGFRCDVAYMVPMDFWEATRRELDSIKPLFMLAEAEGPEFHAGAFDMTYGWELHHLMNDIAAGKKPVKALLTYWNKEQEAYGATDMRMYFTTNHDENSWNGTVYERMGLNHRNFFVLSTTFPNAVPLVYSGQEAGLNKALAFFEKDTIRWGNDALADFYSSMLHLKLQHPALLNDARKTSFEVLTMDTLGSPGSITYERQNDDARLRVSLNFSDEERSVLLPKGESWYNAYTGESLAAGRESLEVPPHDFIILSNLKTNY